MMSRHSFPSGSGGFIALAERTIAVLSLAGAGCLAATVGVTDAPDLQRCEDAGCSGAGGAGKEVASAAGTQAGGRGGDAAGAPVTPDAGPAVPPLTPCGALPRALIDDFDTGRMNWYFIDDGLGTRAFPDGVILEPGGPGSSLFVARMAGGGFTNWGAFAETALTLNQEACVYDLSAFAGLRFAVKAATHGSFRVELPTRTIQGSEYGGTCSADCGDFHGYDFRVPLDTWVECSVRFEDLQQLGYGAPAAFDLEGVQDVRLHFTSSDQPFDLQVDDVEFVPSISATRCARLPDANAAPGDAGTASLDAG